MEDCANVPYGIVRMHWVLLVLAFSAALFGAITLAELARRSGSKGPAASLTRISLPPALVVLEVIFLWQSLADHEPASKTLFSKLLELPGCTPTGDTGLLGAGWLLPAALAALTAFLAGTRELLVGFAGPVLRQVTEAVDEGGAPQQKSARVWLPQATRAAAVDAVVACAVVFLLAHVPVAQAAFRGFGCAAAAGSSRPGRPEGCNSPIFWGSATLLAVLVNVILPTALLGGYVHWARRRRLLSGGFFRDVLPQSELQLRKQVLTSMAALLPFEPWVPGQLALDALAVASVELGAALGTPEGRSLGLAWAQVILFAEVLLLLWPRWHLDARLVRFNASLRVSLLVASHLNKVCSLTARTLPWPVAVVFAVVWALQHLQKWAASNRADAALQAAARSLGIRRARTSTLPVPFSPLVELACDLSQGSLSLILNGGSKPTRGANCGFSPDESVILSAAGDLVSAWLAVAARRVGHREMSCGTADLLAATLARDLLDQHTDRSMTETTTQSSSSEWVAPLPLLATDDDNMNSKRKQRETDSKGKRSRTEQEMLHKKWLLDHFVPASSGPDVFDSLPNDTMPLGASAVTPQDPFDGVVANNVAARPVQLQLLPRLLVNSKSAEELVCDNGRPLSHQLSERRSKTGPLMCVAEVSAGSTGGPPRMENSSRRSSLEVAEDIDWQNVLAGLPPDSRADSERFWQSEQDDLGEVDGAEAAGSVDLKVVSPAKVENALAAAQHWQGPPQRALSWLSGARPSWIQQGQSEEVFAEFLDSSPPGCLLRLLCARESLPAVQETYSEPDTPRLLRRKSRRSHRVPVVVTTADNVLGGLEASTPPTRESSSRRMSMSSSINSIERFPGRAGQHSCTLSEDMSVTSSRDTYDLIQAAINVTQEPASSPDGERRTFRRLEKQLEVLRAENLKLRRESDQLKAKRGSCRHDEEESDCKAEDRDSWPTRPTVRLITTDSKQSGGSSTGVQLPQQSPSLEMVDQTTEQVDLQPELQKSQDEEGGNDERPTEEASQDDKKLQWERWKARKQSKRSQAGKVNYGQWLKNMTDN